MIQINASLNYSLSACTETASLSRIHTMTSAASYSVCSYCWQLNYPEALYTTLLVLVISGPLKLMQLASD